MTKGYCMQVGGEGGQGTKGYCMQVGGVGGQGDKRVLYAGWGSGRAG